MVRIPGKAFWLFLPASAEVCIRGESFERLESLGEVRGQQECLQVGFQGLVGLVVICFHRGVFARAVHAFHWASRPGMVGVGQPMVAARLMTDAITEMLKGVLLALAVGKLEAMIGQPGVDRVRYGGDQVP
jgi:hypothetical protein